MDGSSSQFHIYNTRSSCGCFNWRLFVPQYATIDILKGCVDNARVLAV